MAVVPGIPGRQVARRSDVATRSGGAATQRHLLSTRHPDGAPVAVEEDAAAVTKLLFVRLISAAKQSSACLTWERKKIKRKSSPWIRPDVDMHASSHVGHVMCSGKVPF